MRSHPRKGRKKAALSYRLDCFAFSRPLQRAVRAGGGGGALVKHRRRASQCTVAYAGKRAAWVRAGTPAPEAPLAFLSRGRQRRAQQLLNIRPYAATRVACMPRLLQQIDPCIKELSCHSHMDLAADVVLQVAPFVHQGGHVRAVVVREGQARPSGLAAECRVLAVGLGG